MKTFEFFSVEFISVNLLKFAVSGRRVWGDLSWAVVRGWREGWNCWQWGKGRLGCCGWQVGSGWQVECGWWMKR